MYACVYLRTFVARGRENCRTAAVFGAATLPPAGRQLVQPKLILFFFFPPATSLLFVFLLHLYFILVLRSQRGMKEDLLQAAFADVSTLRYIRLFWFRLLQTGSTRCASGSDLTLISFDSSAGNNETDKEGWGWREGMMSLERKLGYQLTHKPGNKNIHLFNLPN